MDDVAPHVLALREAAPIRVCMMSLLAFAFHRSDYAMVEAIERMIDDPPEDLENETLLERQLADALRLTVADVELIWWLQVEKLARAGGTNRIIYHRLARQRVRSSGH